MVDRRKLGAGFAGRARRPRAPGAPAIGGLSLRGLQAGATTILAVDGSELGPDARILLDAPLAKQTQKPGATANRAEFEVTLDPQVPPGIYLLRIAGPTGVSAAVPIGIDALPQVPVAAEAPQLPVAMSGALNGSTVQSVGFTGKKGDRVVVEVESRRLGANLNPTVHLYDARHVQLAWSQGLPVIGGDARLDAALPADGKYTVELHDALFRGADPGFYRLKIGDFKYAGLVHPLGVVRGAPTPLEFVASNLPKSQGPMAMPAELGERPAPWPAGVPLVSGSRPKLIVSAAGEIAEQPAGDKLQEIPAAPVAISGRLAARGELDRYRITVAPGQALRFDVLASRIGSPVDGVLSVLNEQGGQLATNDDRPGTTDPGLDLTVPADAKALIVTLRDLEGRGGEQFVYRISIRGAGDPDFSLSAIEDRWLVPKDGALVVRIKADRNNYPGPIQLALNPVPPNLVVSGTEIPAGASETLLSLSAPGLAPAQAIAGLVGRGTDAVAAIERPLLLGDSAAVKFQPWLRGEVGLAVTPAGPLAVVWQSFSPETKLQLTSALPIKVQVARAAGVTGAVRLVLLTSQPALKKTIKVINQDQVVDDVDRLLRLAEPVVIAAEQNEATAKILVPADLPLMAYDLAIKAELLSADQKAVAATEFAAAQRMPAVAADPRPAEQPLAVFEDQPEFVANLKLGGGQATLETGEKFSGAASLKVTPDQKYNESLPGLAVKIREKPGAGEYRYLQFAWRKDAGQTICLQIGHDGQFGPAAGRAEKFRYHAGPGAEAYGASIQLAPALPAAFTVVTRDLFFDFGEFTLTGLGFSPIDGNFALFDHIYLGKTPADFELVKP